MKKHRRQAEIARAKSESAQSAPSAVSPSSPDPSAWQIRRPGEILVERAAGSDPAAAPKVSISVSSETPILSWRTWNDQFQQVWEILDHSESSINREYIRDGLPLFDRHGGDQVAIIPEPKVAGGKLGGVPAWSATQRGQDLKQDVEKLIRRNVSVDGAVDPESYKLEGERDGIPVIRATRWTPLGASFVGIPADPSVGVGRGTSTPPPTATPEPKEPAPMKENEIAAAKGETPQAPSVQVVRSDRDKETVEMIALAITHKIAPDVVQRAIAEGKSLADFQKEVLGTLAKGQNTVAREVPADGSAADIGLTQKEVKRFSFIRAIQSFLPGSGVKADFEQECSRAVAAKIGKAPTGIYIPNDVLQASPDGVRRDLDIANTTGSYVVANNLHPESFIDLLRNLLVFVRMGSPMLTGLVGDVAIPKLATGITSYWVTEGNAPTEGISVLAQATGTPHCCAALEDISRKLLKQSTPGAEQLVRNDIAASIAAAIDSAGLVGTGAGYPTGIKYTSGTGNIAIATDGTPTHAELLGFPGSVMAYNARFENCRWVMPAAVWEKCASTARGTGDGFCLEPSTGKMLGFLYEVSQQVTAKHLFFGDWAQAVLCMWGALDLLVDPYTGSNTGTVRIVGMQDVDWIFRIPGAFAWSAELIA